MTMGKPTTPAEREKAIALAGKGFDLRDIAARVSLSQDTLRKLFKKHGVTVVSSRGQW